MKYHIPFEVIVASNMSYSHACILVRDCNSRLGDIYDFMVFGDPHKELWEVRAYFREAQKRFVKEPELFYVE